MPKELGESVYGTAVGVTEESDGTNMTAGDAVTQDGSEQVGPTGDGDDLYGVVMRAANENTDLSDLSAGDEVVVCVHGDVITNVGTSVTRGDLVETSSTAGQLAQNVTGTEVDVNEGGTDTYTIAQATAKALSDEDGTIQGHDLSANEALLFVY